MNAKFSTKSERLFEEYLKTSGHQRWSFEPTIENRSKHPDFLVPWEGRDILFEVKQRQRKGPFPDGAVHTDPVRGIREEIHETRKKFKEFRDHCCALVIFNAGDWKTDLAPIWVFGAMLGDPGFTFGIANDVEDSDDFEGVFLPRGGKMINYSRSQFQNTTISAVIVLEEVTLRIPEYERALREQLRQAEARRGRRLEERERAKLGGKLFCSMGVAYPRVTRVRICEHPAPRVAFPPGMFTGAYDERWAIVDRQMKRTYAGSKLDQIYDINRAQAAWDG